MSQTTVTFDKASLLTKIHLLTIGIVLICVVLFAVLGAPVYKVWIAAAMVLFLSASLWGMKCLSVRNSTNCYLFCTYCFLTLYAAVTGGIEAPGIVWFIILPLVSFLMLSTRIARYWLVAVLLTIGAFYFFDDYLVFDVFHHLTIWFLVSYVLLFLMVYLLIRIFRLEVSKRSLEFVKLNQMLRAKQSELQTSQSELILQRDLLREAEAEATSRSKKIGIYLDLLLEVNRMEELHTGSLEYATKAIQRLLIRTMNLEHVTLWNLSTDQTLELIGSMGAKEKNVFQSAKLAKEDFPDTFELLESGAVVTSHSNMEFHSGVVFREDRSTYSSVSCPYFIGGKFAGFLRCVATSREWSAEDIIFVRAISDTLPLAFKSYERKQQQNLLEEKQNEIRQLNESLEQKVIERTAELKLRNQQLVDFAFINAHEIRGPICRLLGLRSLLHYTSDPEEINTLNNYIFSSIEDLDQVTKKTSNQLNQIVTAE